MKRLKQLIQLRRSKLTDDEYYEEDSSGRGIIDVGAENYDDVFSYYDLDGENVLDKEFDNFLNAKADAIPIKQELALHFHVRGATEEKCEEIDRAIKSNYKRELKALNRQLYDNTMMTIYLLCLGIISFAIYIALRHFNVGYYVDFIFEIITWVFLWEVVDNCFIVRRKIQNERLKKYRFIRANIELYEYTKQKITSKNLKLNRKIIR